MADGTSRRGIPGGPSRTGLSPKDDLSYVSSHRARAEYKSGKVVKEIGLGHVGEISVEDVANQYSLIFANHHSNVESYAQT